MTTATRRITESHLDEWVKGSGVKDAIARLNLESLDDSKEIARRLNWKAYKGKPGWWASGVDPRTGQPRAFGQFKPNEPLQMPDDDPAKYVTGPKGSPTEAFFANTGDVDYWLNILTDRDELVAITEGFKKAGAGITAGIPTVALAGVWNGQVDKKRLIPDLKLIATPGRWVCLIFDSDILTKPEVQQALILLGKLLKKAGCLVTVAQLPAETKGMDDFIVAHGGEEFKKLVRDALAYDTWLTKLEEQFQGGQKQKTKGNTQRTAPQPQPVVIAADLIEKYRSQLAWNDEIKSWFRYEAEFAGIWSIESDIAIEGVVGAELDSDPRTSQQYSYNYLTNVINVNSGYSDL